MAASDIELLAVGVDPYNSVDTVPLQRHRARYEGMTRFSIHSVLPAYR